MPLAIKTKKFGSSELKEPVTSSLAFKVLVTSSREMMIPKSIESSQLNGRIPQEDESQVVISKGIRD